MPPGPLPSVEPPFAGRAAIAEAPEPSRASWLLAATRLRTRTLSWLMDARRMRWVSNCNARSSLSGENTAQPERPQSRQYTAGRNRSASCAAVMAVTGALRAWNAPGPLVVPGESQRKSARGHGNTPRTSRETDRAH